MRAKTNSSKIYIFLLILLVSCKIGSTQDTLLYDSYFKGVAAYEYRDYNTAIDHFTAAIQKEPDNYHCYMMRGSVFFILKKYQNALNDFEKADMIKTGISAYEIASCYSLTGNTSESIKYLTIHLKSANKKPQSVIKLDKSFAPIEKSDEWKKLWTNDWYSKNEQELAEAEYYFKNKKITEALELLQKMLETHKKYHEAYYLRGRIFESLKDDKDALEDYDKAIEINKRTQEYYITRAKVNYRIEKYKQALSDYNTAIETDPLDMKLYFERGLTYLRLKKYDNALNDFTFYAKYFTRSDETIYQTGIIYFEQKDYDKALEYFRKALEMNRGISKYFVAMGNCYTAKSMFKEAEFNYSQALDLNPKESHTWFSRGMVRIYLKKNMEACKDLKKAADLGNAEAINQFDINCE